MRDVRLLEPRDLVVAQRELLGRERVLEVLELRRADDRRGDAGLVEQPGERDLRRRDAALRRDLGDPVDDGEVDLRAGTASRRTDRCSRACVSRSPPRVAVAGEQAARERAPRDDARRPGRCTAGSSPAPPRGR